MTSPHGTHETSDTYDGQALGLPRSGPGSLAPLGKRVVALFVDWLVALAITYGAIVPIAGGLTQDQLAWTPLLVFVLLTIVLVATNGRTLGHAILGLRVIPAARPRLTWLQALIRTLMVALIIPPVVWDRHGRGLHDLAAGTLIVRSR